MLRRKKIFFITRIVAVFFMGMFVAVVIALASVKLESLRENVVSILKDSTGLPVQVDGEMSWRFSLRPRIELNDVRIPNADWAKKQYAFDAKRIVVRIDLISLFCDKASIKSMKIYDLNVDVEKNSKGEYSLNFQSDDLEKNKEQTSQIIDKFPIVEIPIEKINIENLKAFVVDKNYNLSALELRFFDRKFEREFSGWVKPDDSVYPFIVKFLQIDEEKNLYPVDVALSIGGKTLVSKLSLDKESKSIVDFSVKGEIANYSLFEKFLNFDFSKISTVTLDVKGRIGKRIVFDDSVVGMRGNFIKFSGNCDFNMSDVNLNVQSNNIDLIKLVPGLYSGWQRPNRELNVFKDMDLYGKEIKKYNFVLNAKINNFIVYRNMNIKNINAKIKFNKGQGRIDLESGFAGGKIKIASNVNIDDEDKFYSRTAFRGSEIFVGNIMKEIRINDFISGLPVNIDAYFEASGANMSEIMQTITGPVRMYSTKSGMAYKQLVENVYGADFLVTLRHNIQDLFTDKKHDKMTLSCVAVNAKLRNGVLNTKRGIAAETNVINAGLSGSLDLGREHIELALTTVPVRGLKLSLTGNLVNTIEIIGNLAEPDVRINGVAVAGKALSATGIGLLLAPFTGGIGLVAGAGVGLVAGNLLENWLADDNPCETALDEGADKMRNDPEWLNESIEDLQNTVF
ncbi:MAG: AsmA family protein [Alphaproteobacteria bacterium]